MSDPEGAAPGAPAELSSGATTVVPRGSRSAAVQLGARVALALVGVGVVVGLVWWWLAPVAQVRIESDGGYFVDPDPESYIASDMWFAGLSLVAGLLAGALLWRYVHRSAIAGVVGLAVGGAVGAMLGAWLGERLGHVDPASVRGLPLGSVVHVSLDLQAAAVLVVLPVAALVGWVVRDLVQDVLAARSGAGGATPDAAMGPGGEPPEVSPADPPGPPPLPSG